MASPDTTANGGRSLNRSYLPILAIGAALTIAVALSTQLGFPKSADWRAALYVIFGLAVTVLIAVLAERSQTRIHKEQEHLRRDFRSFLMQRVDSRRARTEAVIELCEKAEHKFCAVTYFPVVGIQDEPSSAPRRYLNALEGKLVDDEIEVVLVSVSCTEAKEYCEEKGFKKESVKALAWIETRLTELIERFPSHLTVITVPGSAITVNVCHNHSTALMYHMSPVDDEGSGFKSTDPMVMAVAKGGAWRYATYSQRNGSSPAEG